MTNSINHSISIDPFEDINDNQVPT